MSDNPNNGEQPNRDAHDQGDVQAAFNIDPRQQVLNSARDFIEDLPSTIRDCTPYQVALLTNNNGALHLDRPHPTHPPTTNAASRRAPMTESLFRGGNYINAEIAPMYTTSDIENCLSHHFEE